MAASGIASKDVVITYDTVFDMLRNEKSREELQPLSATFLKDIVNYLNDKKILLEKQDHTNPFADGESRKTMQQLDNIHRMIRELYDRRERKIALMALNKVRITSAMIDISALLDEEKVLFETLCQILSRMRVDMLQRILEGREPIVTQVQLYDQKQAASELEDEQKKILEADNPEQQSNHVGLTVNAASEQSHSLFNQRTKLIRFLNHVPRFVGSELEVYGPFEEDDVASLPGDIADAIIKKGRGEEMKEDDSK